MLYFWKSRGISLRRKVKPDCIDCLTVENSFVYNKGVLTIKIDITGKRSTNWDSKVKLFNILRMNDQNENTL